MKKILSLTIFLITMNAFLGSPVKAEEKLATPRISSETAIVIEANTGEVLYDKASEKEMYPASLTKIATAIYAIENGDLNDQVTVSEKANNTGGSSVYLRQGDRVKLRQLVQGLLINSGNDAGVAIAEHLSGSVKQFSADLNEYLKQEVGVQDTTFVNPHGLFNNGHVTTAKDLALITKYAMKNEEFIKIFGQEKLEWNSESWTTTLYTHHKLMREMPYEGVTGGKTGYVGQSGFTLATSAERKGTSLVVITMNNQTQDQMYEDTKELLDYGFDNYETTTLEKGTVLDFAGDEYMLPKALSYTHRKNHSIKQSFKKPSQLVITDSTGKELSSMKLNKVLDLVANTKHLLSDNPEKKSFSVQGSSMCFLIANRTWTLNYC